MAQRSPEILFFFEDIALFAEMGFKCYRLSIALIKKYGGWKDRRMIDAFVRYCEVLFDNFGGALCVLPGGFWTNRLKNSKIRSECARMLDSIL